MTAIFEPDHHVAVALRAAIDTRHRAVSLMTAEALVVYLRNHPETMTVVLGPSVASPIALGLASSVRAERSELAVVLVRYGVDPALVDRAARCGVQEVLDAGDTEGLNRAVLRHHEPAVDPAAGDVGKVITVFSTKGGSGKTTMAVNLAAVLSAGGARRVCLLDLDLAYGDVATSLHMFPLCTLADVAAYQGRLDEATIAPLLTSHSPGLSALVAPVTPGSARQIPATLVSEVIEVLRRSMDYVIIDTPAAFDDQVLAALDVSDVVALIATLDIPALKNLKLTVETMRLLSYPSGRWRVVLNRADSDVGLDLADVQRLLGSPIAAQVPSSRDVPASVNRGVPLTVSSPEHPVSAAISEFAAGHVVAAAQAPSAGGTGTGTGPRSEPRPEPRSEPRPRVRLFGLRRSRGA